MTVNEQVLVACDSPACSIGLPVSHSRTLVNFRGVDSLVNCLSPCFLSQLAFGARIAYLNGER
jgi:hypothetical protein